MQEEPKKETFTGQGLVFYEHFWIHFFQKKGRRLGDQTDTSYVPTSEPKQQSETVDKVIFLFFFL